MTQEIDFHSNYHAMIQQAEMVLAETRAELLKELRTLGVLKIKMWCEGYDDSGNAGCISLAPSHVSLDKSLGRRLEDFG